MRIVAVADTHTFHADLGVLPDGDVFVHAGDLLRGGTLDELEDVARWMRDLPHPTKIVVAGNHDWCFVRDRERALEMLGAEVVYLEDAALTLHGLNFYGSPWQPEYNAWAFNLPRGQALRDKWQLIPKGTDVLITHGPPAGLGDRSSVAGRWGCEELRDAVAVLQPALHLFGHIHPDGGFWQRGTAASANVTTWECERGPTVIDIDPATRVVTPVAVPPARRVR